MGCPALGIWVGFLKQPALPGEGHQKQFFKKNSKKTNHKTRLKISSVLTRVQ
jgi:hypothetical protein